MVDLPSWLSWLSGRSASADAPAYDPDYWNAPLDASQKIYPAIDDPNSWSDPNAEAKYDYSQPPKIVLRDTNCYEYAVAGNSKRRDGTVASPGESRFIYNINAAAPSLTSENLRALAEADGLAYAGNGTARPPHKEGHYLVAGYVGTYGDPPRTAGYHWVRENSDGTFSQKLDVRPVELVKDALGNPVHEAPAQMKDGSITYQNVGYFYVPKEGLAVGMDALIDRVASGTPLDTPPPPDIKGAPFTLPKSGDVAHAITAITRAWTDGANNDGRALKYQFEQMGCDVGFDDLRSGLENGTRGKLEENATGLSQFFHDKKDCGRDR